MVSDLRKKMPIKLMIIKRTKRLILKCNFKIQIAISFVVSIMLKGFIGYEVWYCRLARKLTFDHCQGRFFGTPEVANLDLILPRAQVK